MQQLNTLLQYIQYEMEHDPDGILAKQHQYRDHTEIMKGSKINKHVSNVD